MEKAHSSIKPILIYIFVLFSVWTLRATVFHSIDESIESDSIRRLYSTFVMFCFFALPVFLYLIFYDKTDSFKYLKLSTPIKKTDLIFSIVATILFFSGIVAFSIFLDGKNLNALFEADVVTIFYILFRTLPSSFFEEILFRGFLLNKFREHLKFWQANLIQALLFGAIHLPFWLFSRGLQTSVMADFTAVFVLGCFLGYILKKTNSLWFCVAVHIINNFWAGFLRAK
jgi:membrane protease YdiL (CAAX protease family)